MNKKLRALKEEIERRGRVVGLSPNIPDAVAEEFVREILECPYCLEEAKKARIPGSGREH
jgi:hypothetical protein